MTTAFKVGDKVKYIQHEKKTLTNGKTYEVTRYDFDNVTDVPSKYDMVTVINDHGHPELYFRSRFELVKDSHNLESLVALAKTFLGKTCKYDTLVPLTPDKILVYVDGSLVQESSYSVIQDFNTYGYTVALKDSKKLSTVPVRGTVLSLSHTVKLTDEYDAEVFPDKVVVGCQTITKEKIDELHKLIHSYD